MVVKSVEYITKLIPTLQEGKTSIGGIAITSSVTRNGIFYSPEELQIAASSLIGRPLLKDHNNSIDSIVGIVSKAEYADGAIHFGADVMDESISAKIAAGLIRNVSIGAIYKELEEHEDYAAVKGIEFVELSLVAVPGDKNATLDMVLSEAWHKQKEENKVKEAIKTMTETKPVTEAKLVKEEVCSKCGQEIPETKKEAVVDDKKEEPKAEDPAKKGDEKMDEQKLASIIALTVKETVGAMQTKQIAETPKSVVAAKVENTIVREADGEFYDKRIIEMMKKT